MKWRLIKLLLFCCLGCFGASLFFGLGYVCGLVKSSKYRSDAMVGQAESEAQVIAYGLRKFHEFYKSWPTNAPGVPDLIFGPGNQKQCLDAVFSAATTNRQFRTNVVLGIDAYKAGEYIDPWGKPYFILFDSNNDGKCVSDRWGELPGRGPYVWSEGSGPATSWTRRSLALPRDFGR